MVSASSSSVLLSALSTCCCGGVGCVSILVITKVDDVASSCDKRLMLFESLRDGIIRICPSEPFESANDLLSMVLCLKCVCG